MSRRTHVAVGLLLAAGLVWLFLRQANLGEVWKSLRNADPTWILVALATILLSTLLRAWRWRQLLSPLGAVALRPLVDCTLMAWTVSVVLPGRLGEIVRPVLLARRTPIRASAAMGSVVLERAFDVVAIVLYLGIYLLVFPPPPALQGDAAAVFDAIRLVALLGAAGILVAAVTVAAASRNRRLKARGKALAKSWLPTRVASIAASFVDGMSGLRSPGLVACIIGSSMLLWGVIDLMYVVLFRAFGIDLPAYASIPLVTLLVAGVVVPTPAAVGAFHKAAQIGLVTLFGIDNDVAVAFAIVSHTIGFLPLGVLGAVLLAREGLTFAALRRMGETPGEGPRDDRTL
ncbi:MAG TPA: lysylphosphatidylglycerol synthase transmembrane domain-containing protein [Acidobacteriota bacterium]|nr:lysylphosphatidylglycerol synthase transmembrane domain-containing protein [Acidobacteriota bacterium]